VRAQPAVSSQEHVRWDPARGALDVPALSGYDAVVHLAGEPIVGRWTQEKKQRIRESRILGTRLLAEALAKLAKPPQVLVSASAIGYYGHRGEELLTERSAGGRDFLAEVCREWEAAAAPAAAKGIRVVQLRLGIVLSARGGALQAMLPPFRLGLGGVVGSGTQYWSWVALEDVVGAFLHALRTEALQGPANVVAPQPVTNREFTAALGKVLKRPTVFPLPARVARLLLGEMAEALLLSSTRVAPKRLQETGYVFRFPALDGALRHALA
jgi:uncharacterized protein (TIGR01777 family)